MTKYSGSIQIIKPRTIKTMWVDHEYIVGSRPWSGVFLRLLRFSSLHKTSTSKFQFDRESEGHRFVSRQTVTSSPGKSLWKVRVAQQWKQSLPTNVAHVRFPEPASYVDWVCCWFLSLFPGFFLGFSGFSPSTKNSPNSNSIWNQWTKNHSVDVPLKNSYLFIKLFIYVFYLSF